MADQPVPFTFDGELPEAISAAEQMAADLVTVVTDETKKAIRAIIVRGIDEGIPPRQIARLVRDLVGLTDRDAQAAMNLRAALLEEGLAASTVEDRVRRYAEKKIRQRAMTIARTETIDAMARGNDIAWADARRKGYLRDDTQQEWIADPAACEICLPLDGQVVPLGQPFIHPVTQAEYHRPTVHPQCKCTRALVT